MNVRTLKMADACSISGYTRDQMRGLLRELPVFTKNQVAGRNREFTRVELLTITVISYMEQRYGIKRGAIKEILEKLIKTLEETKKVNSQSCLVIVIGESSVLSTYINEIIPEGLVIPLAPIQEQLDTYLGVKVHNKQFEINF